MVILTLKGCASHTTINLQANSLSRIQLKTVSNKRDGGPQGSNMSDNPGGFTKPSSKSLALVENISGSCGGGWRQFLGPCRLLGKVGMSLGV